MYASSVWLAHTCRLASSGVDVTAGGDFFASIWFRSVGLMHRERAVFSDGRQRYASCVGLCTAFLAHLYNRFVLDASDCCPKSVHLQVERKYIPYHRPQVSAKEAWQTRLRSDETLTVHLMHRDLSDGKLFRFTTDVGTGNPSFSSKSSQ